MVRFNFHDLAVLFQLYLFKFSAWDKKFRQLQNVYLVSPHLFISNKRRIREAPGLASRLKLAFVIYILYKVCHILAMDICDGANILK